MNTEERKGRRSAKFKGGDVVNVRDAGGSIIWRAVVIRNVDWDVMDDTCSYRVSVPGEGYKGPYTESQLELAGQTTRTDPVASFGNIDNFIPGTTVNGQLTAIHANGKVWKLKQIAEALLRKMQPVGTVAKDYFPLADRARAAVAWLGNEKHNPGQHLHWARGKSDDHLDCAGRHLTESEDWDVTVLPDGRAFAVLHAAQLAWRAAALAQLAAEKYGGRVILELEVPCGGETAQDRR